MLAPALLCTSRSPVRSRIAAVIAAVVVLPFVALITALPCASRRARIPIACGSSRVSTLPGSDVPPPRPAARTTRADRLGGGHLRAQQRHGTSTFNERGTTLMVTGRSAIGSPSA